MGSTLWYVGSTLWYVEVYAVVCEVHAVVYGIYAVVSGVSESETRNLVNPIRVVSAQRETTVWG